MIDAINAILDPIFSPLLALGNFYAILILAFLISLMITVIYKMATDQQQMKYYKDKIKKHQEEMKAAKDDPDKVMKIQKKAMAINMEYMKLSMKPTLYTFIPIILIFGWMSSTFAFTPLLADEPFMITVQVDKSFDDELRLGSNGLSLESSESVLPQNGFATWKLSGPEGVYIIDVSAPAEIKQAQVFIGEQEHIPDSDVMFNDGSIRKISIGYGKNRPMEDIPILGSIPWIGSFGWLGTYILFSIIFSISIRKILKVH
ncbi:DUF106 domain-containing protein [Candidatus Woesearchaeota archaeon]|nr:DUF106 domain-containing protein [Candidatus Woesearchaeota archaeon]